MGKFWAIFLWILATGERAAAQQYPFLRVAGSPKSIQSLFQDSRGRLWTIGAELACFDGSRFFFLRDYGFPAAGATDVSEDPSGAIWIAAETGVYRFAGGRVEEILRGTATSVIAGRADTAVALIAPSANLVRIRRNGAGWKTEVVANLDSAGPLTIDQNGNLLYPWTTLGWGEIRFSDVVQWRAGTSLPVIHHGTRGLPTNGGWRVMRDRSGCVWNSAPHSNAFYDCGDGKKFALFEGALLESSIHESADGTMTLSGESLVAVGKPGAFQIATRANGLPGLADALRGNDGTVWLAANGGLFRFASPFRVENWTIREGLPDPPWSIARVGPDIYAGLEQRIVKLDKDRQRWSTIATFPYGSSVSGLLATEDGNLLASFLESGAVELRPDGHVIARTEKDHPKPGAMRWGKTPDGEIWLGGHSLSRVKRVGSVLQVDDHPLQTQPSGNVLAIKYEEHTHRLWSCYNGGLVTRDPQGEWKEFTTADGLLKNGCWALAPLPNGDVWYGYYNFQSFGLVHPENGRISVREYGKESVADPTAVSFEIDSSGRVWRGGASGVYVADPAQAEAAQWIALDESDGFTANGMNTGSVFLDTDGSLWWGEDNDLAHYIPPADLVAPRFAPQVFVSAFSWEGQSPKLAEAVDHLPHGMKITAHIGSLQFDRRNALKIRYRVLPDQPVWRETNNLDLALGPLSSGDHTFEVQGRVFTGPWSGTVTRTINVLRPAWLAWPFLIGYLIAIPTLATSGYLVHRKRKADDAKLLPDLSPWRREALLPNSYDLNGTVLDSRFEAGKLLARGGFANVMEGYDRVKRQRCAIKVFRNEVTDARDQAWIEHRFEQEVAALERVHHPNVVSIYAHGAAPSGIPFLVMEFIEGRNLREVLKSGALPANRTARFLKQLASALDTIHAHGICHRDVKPDNMIVRREGLHDEAVVLLDFSIAIVKDANKTLHGVSRAAGTFAYMPPEQAVGHAEPASDIYSLAKVVIEMMTGRSLADLLPEATIDLPERVREMLSAWPNRLSDASIEMLAAAVAFDPSRRPRGAGAFAKPLIQDLQGDLSSEE